MLNSLPTLWLNRLCGMGKGKSMNVIYNVQSSVPLINPVALGIWNLSTITSLSSFNFLQSCLNILKALAGNNDTSDSDPLYAWAVEHCRKGSWYQLWNLYISYNSPGMHCRFRDMCAHVHDLSSLIIKSIWNDCRNQTKFSFFFFWQWRPNLVTGEMHICPMKIKQGRHLYTHTSNQFRQFFQFLLHENQARQPCWTSEEVFKHVNYRQEII